VSFTVCGNAANVKMRTIFLLVCLVVLLGSRVEAQSKCPINLPFRVTITITGSYKTSQAYSVADTQNLVHTYEFVIDSFQGLFYYSADSLFFQQPDPGSEYGYDTASIYFDTAKGVISSLFLSHHSYVPITTGYSLEGTVTTDWAVRCNGIQYSRSSIVTTGPLTGPDDQVFSDDYDHWVKIGDIDEGYKFLKGSFAISGATSGVKDIQPPQATLSVVANSGSLTCSFAPSDHSRELEVFTPLGIEATHVEVQADRSEVALPQLPAGIYFVRLEEDLAKVYLAP